MLFSRYLNLFLAFWSCIKKPGLIRKVRLISKFLTSEPEEQYIAIHMLLKTPRGKGNEIQRNLVS